MMMMIESLLKTACVIFDCKNWEIRFYKRIKVSFLIVKTVTCKRGITVVVLLRFIVFQSS